MDVKDAALLSAIAGGTAAETALAELQLEYLRVCAERDAALSSNGLRVITLGEGEVIIGTMMYMGYPAIVITKAVTPGKSGEKPGQDTLDMLDAHSKRSELPPDTTIIRFTSLQAVESFVETHLANMLQRVVSDGE